MRPICQSGTGHVGPVLGPTSAPDPPHTGPSCTSWPCWTPVGLKLGQVGANWPEFGASYAQVGPKWAPVRPNLRPRTVKFDPSRLLVGPSRLASFLSVLFSGCRRFSSRSDSNIPSFCQTPIYLTISSVICPWCLEVTEFSWSTLRQSNLACWKIPYFIHDSPSYKPLFMENVPACHVWFLFFVDDFSQKPLFDGDFPYILCHVHDVVAPTSPSQRPLSIEEFHRSARATVASVATQHQDATGETMPWCPIHHGGECFIWIFRCSYEWKVGYVLYMFGFMSIWYVGYDMMGCHKNIVVMVIEVLFFKNRNQKKTTSLVMFDGETNGWNFRSWNRRYYACLRLPSSNKMESHSWDNHLYMEEFPASHVWLPDYQRVNIQTVGVANIGLSSRSRREVLQLQPQNYGCNSRADWCNLPSNMAASLNLMKSH